MCTSGEDGVPAPSESGRRSLLEVPFLDGGTHLGRTGSRTVTLHDPSLPPSLSRGTSLDSPSLLGRLYSSPRFPCPRSFQ